MPGTTSPTSGLTSAALTRRPGQGPAEVSEAQGFDLRRSREPGTGNRGLAGGSALSLSQPPGGCLRRNPGPSGALSLSTHVIGPRL